MLPECEHEMLFCEQPWGQQGRVSLSPFLLGGAAGKTPTRSQRPRYPSQLSSNTLGPALHVKAFTSQSPRVFTYKMGHAALPVRSHGSAPCSSRHKTDRSVILKTSSQPYSSFPHPSTKGDCRHYFINKITCHLSVHHVPRREVFSPRETPMRHPVSGEENEHRVGLFHLNSIQTGVGGGGWSGAGAGEEARPAEDALRNGIGVGAGVG